MPFTLSPNMNLIIATVGSEPGPTFATDVNNSLTIVDGHNHTPGFGVSIPSSGLNINSDLLFNNNNATLLRTTRFKSQGTTLSSASDVGCLYEVLNDLFYNDGVGNVVRITQSGAVAGTPGSISGLVSPASASYNAGTSTFVWQSNTNTSANMDAASYLFRNLVANSKALTLSPPTAMASNFTITLPTLPVSATSFLRMDTSGNISASTVQDNNTILISAGVMSAHTVSSFEFKLNNTYGNLTTPKDLDGMVFFPFNATITDVWAYNEGVGSSGTTTLDLRSTASSCGSFTSVFSTLASFTSASAANSYVDSAGIQPPTTGVTAPVLTSSSVTAGTALKFFITSVMTGGSNCGLIVQFKQT